MEFAPKEGKNNKNNIFPHDIIPFLSTYFPLFHVLYLNGILSDKESVVLHSIN